jgi:hypothetical protein
MALSPITIGAAHRLIRARCDVVLDIVSDNSLVGQPLEVANLPKLSRKAFARSEICWYITDLVGTAFLHGACHVTKSHRRLYLPTASTQQGGSVTFDEWT